MTAERREQIIGVIKSHVDIVQGSNEKGRAIDYISGIEQAADAILALPALERPDDWQATALKAMDADITRLKTALEIIAGRRQCIDNLLGNKDIACLALDKNWPPAAAIVAEERGQT